LVCKHYPVNFKAWRLPGFFYLNLSDILIAMNNKLLSNQELRRYKKQILLPGIGEKGQEKIKASKILVIGAGGIGTSALQYLASAGVGELGICDNEIIEEENFQNQTLYNSLDLGKQKAIVAKLKLESINSFNNYSVFNIFISAENAVHICRNFELIIDASNDPQIGLVLDEACFLLQIPLIYAERKLSQCKIAVFNYMNGPRIKDYIASGFSIPLDSNETAHSGSFGAIEGIIGNIMATEAFKIISGIGEVLSRSVCVIDPINLKIEYSNFHN